MFCERNGNNWNKYSRPQRLPVETVRRLSRPEAGVCSVYISGFGQSRVINYSKYPKLMILEYCNHMQWSQTGIAVYISQNLGEDDKQYRGTWINDIDPFNERMHNLPLDWRRRTLVAGTTLAPHRSVNTTVQWHSRCASRAPSVLEAHSIRSYDVCIHTVPAIGLWRFMCITFSAGVGCVGEECGDCNSDVSHVPLTSSKNSKPWTNCIGTCNWEC